MSCASMIFSASAFSISSEISAILPSLIKTDQSIQLYMNGYDRMIDEDDEYYKKICEQMNIPEWYGSRENFIEQYAFDKENPYSIMASVERAYDNAMVMRDEISSNTLSYIHMIQGRMKKAAASEAPVYYLQQVLDNILAFWGCLDDEIYDESIRNTVKCGKRVERLDIYLRLRRSKEELNREVRRLMQRIDSTNLTYNRAALMYTAAMIEENPIEYDEVLKKVWQIF